MSETKTVREWRDVANDLKAKGDLHMLVARMEAVGEPLWAFEQATEHFA